MTGIETVALTELIKKIRLPDFAQLWHSYGAGWSNFANQYCRNYATRHGILKVLGMKQPVSLDSIYTTIQLLDESEAQKVGWEKTLLNDFRSRYLYTNYKKQEGVEVANQKQYLAVLGGPGIGKSTFLRKLGLEAITGKTWQFEKRSDQGEITIKQQACIPVFVELKRFKDEKTEILDLILQEFANCGSHQPLEKFIPGALQEGRFLVLLDGLDEVPSDHRDRAKEKIQDFVDKYANNRFVLSSRTAAYRVGALRRFTDVTIAEFNDDQIKDYIHKWFQEPLDREEQVAEKLWEALQNANNEAVMELVRTPLLLTFVCITYDRSQSLPSNRSTLYGRALDILLEEWAADKRLERKPIYEGFHSELEKEMLAEIAYDRFAKDELFFPKDALITQIKTFLANTMGINQNLLEGKAVLDAIEVQQGILLQRLPDTYSFSHLTLQEFLTADYLVKNGLSQQLSPQELVDDRWREVVLLMAGLLRGKPLLDFLHYLEAQALSLIATPELQNLLQWATHYADRLPYKPAANRAFLIYTIAIDIDRAIARDIARAIDIAIDIDIAIAIARAIARDITIDIAITIAIAIAIARARDIARARAIAIARDIAIDQIKQKAHELGASRQNTNDPQIIYVAADFCPEQFIKDLEEIEQARPQEQEQNAEVWRRYGEFAVEKLSNLFRKTFDHTKGVLSMSEEECQSLGKYLTIIKLLLECKNAAVRITPDQWQPIEDRLLTWTPDQKR